MTAPSLPVVLLITSGDLSAGGEGGIRTRVGLLTQTRFPGVRLKPLIHLSAVVQRTTTRNYTRPSPRPSPKGEGENHNPHPRPLPREREKIRPGGRSSGSRRAGDRT